MRALTGIKPSNAPHLGNLIGGIGPALELQSTHEAIFFIADYHALTTVHDPTLMRRYGFEVAAAWLALGLDPRRTILFTQSDVPETTELAWYLACVTGFGALERAHAFKDAVARGKDVNVGLFYYPALMAADILLYGANVVPVGKDQVQHVEITRDMAAAFNVRFGDVLVLPEALVRADSATVPGLDGLKMSKSRGNGIEVFLSAGQLRKKVMSMVTDSRGVDEPKNPDDDNVFKLYRLFATPEETLDLARRYRAGGLGYGHAKQELYEVIERRVGPAREPYLEWMAHPERIQAVLDDGAARARAIARVTIGRVRDACGQHAVPRST